MSLLQAAPVETESLIEAFQRVRGLTERLCEPLSPEDSVPQSMPDCSPAKWHLAHTTWFFETFVLGRFDPSHEPLRPEYAYLFNSYYNAAGPQAPRPWRGLMTRPTLAAVYDYRAHVNAAVERLVGASQGPLQGSAAVAGRESIEQGAASDGRTPALRDVLILGLHHEQQHQELLLTDIKHLLSLNPLRPAYRDAPGGTDAGGTDAPVRRSAAAEYGDTVWHEYPAGLRECGHAGDGFHYDNEGPRHRQYIEAFALADRLVTNAEFLAFIADGGYQRSELWLSAGWVAVQQQGWDAPLYWERGNTDFADWHRFTLDGQRPLAPHAPVSHVSYFEADAYARWAGARLPTEFEWEAAAAELPITGNFVESGALDPLGAHGCPPAAGCPSASTEPPSAPERRVLDRQGRLSHPPAQLFGDVWEWTRSQYSPYPGYAPVDGALGEYNGKWMCNQFVLRGGSCATSASHIRATYRNFFAPDARWQFSGLRLARDLR